MEADWPDPHWVVGFAVWASASSYSYVQFIPERTPFSLSPGVGTGCEPSFVYQLGTYPGHANNTMVLDIGWLKNEEPTMERWLQIHKIE